MLYLPPKAWSERRCRLREPEPPEPARGGRWSRRSATKPVSRSEACCPGEVTATWGKHLFPLAGKKIPLSHPSVRASDRHGPRPFPSRRPLRNEPECGLYPPPRSTPRIGAPTFHDSPLCKGQARTGIPPTGFRERAECVHRLRRREGRMRLPSSEVRFRARIPSIPHPYAPQALPGGEPRPGPPP